MVNPWLRERLDMVELQIRRREVQDERVLDAMTRIPRHLFVPENLHSQAYDDHPLPIGYDQTISQPYIVVAAAPDHVPQPLLDQLALGGRLVIPVGRYAQDLVLIEKSLDGNLKHTKIAGC